MKPQENSKPLEQLLEALTTHGQHFKQLLITEQDALDARDTSEINLIIRKKQDCIEALSHADSIFRNTLNATGYNEHDHLADYLANKFGPDCPLILQLDSFTALFDECRKINQQNNSLVSIGLRQTQQALNLLRGIPGIENDSVYGPAGQTLNNNKGKELAKA